MLIHLRAYSGRLLTGERRNLLCVGFSRFPQFGMLHLSDTSLHLGYEHVNHICKQAHMEVTERVSHSCAQRPGLWRDIFVDVGGKNLPHCLVSEICHRQYATMVPRVTARSQKIHILSMRAACRNIALFISMSSTSRSGSIRQTSPRQ